MLTSSTGSWNKCLSTQAVTIPAMTPSTNPPIDSRMNSNRIDPKDKDYPSTIFNSTRNTTYAVPSLNKDSPSINVANFLLAPSSFNKATTATGSVADIIAPNSTAASNVNYPLYPSTNLITKADRQVDSNRAGPAK